VARETGAAAVDYEQHRSVLLDPATWMAIAVVAGGIIVGAWHFFVV
jgi:hypothetical protein